MQEYENGTVIRNADGFDLALHPAEHIEPSPAFPHAGFRAAESGTRLRPGRYMNPAEGSH